MATPNFQLRQIGRDLEGQYGPGALAGGIGDLAGYLQNTPYFEALLRSNRLGAARTRSGIEARVGRAGGRTSGVGGTVLGMSQGLPGAADAQSYGALIQLASQMMGQNFGQRLGATGYLGSQIDFNRGQFDTMQLLAGLLAGGGQAAAMALGG